MKNTDYKIEHKKNNISAVGRWTSLLLLFTLSLLLSSCPSGITPPGSKPEFDRNYKSPNDTLGIDQVLSITCYASDSESSQLTYHWEIPGWYIPYAEIENPVANPVRIQTKKFAVDSTDTNNIIVFPVLIDLTITNSYRYELAVRDSFWIIPGAMFADLPIIELFEAERDTVAPQDTVNILLSVSNPDTLDTLNISWFNPPEGVVFEQDDHHLKWIAPESYGRQRFDVTVENSDTLLRASTYVVVGSPGTFNNPPAIQRVYPENDNIVLASTTRIICEAFDEEADPLTYNWSSEFGEIRGGGPRIDWTAPDSLGTFLINVRVSDGLATSSGICAVNVVPDTSIYFMSDFSHDDVTNLWSYQGLLAGFGAFPVTYTVEWDEEREKMSVICRSDYSTAGFRLIGHSFLDGSFGISVEATSTQYGMLGFLPKFFGESNYFMVGINFFQQYASVIRCINGQVEYLARYEGIQLTADREYDLLYSQHGDEASVKFNGVNIWSGEVVELFKLSTSMGVAVYGLQDSGPAYFDNIKITNP